LYDTMIKNKVVIEQWNCNKYKAVRIGVNLRLKSSRQDVTNW
jgi:hypothetical protein